MYVFLFDACYPLCYSLCYSELCISCVMSDVLSCVHVVCDVSYVSPV